MRTTVLSAAAIAVASFGATVANASTVNILPGNSTDITVTAPLTDLGLGARLTGSATVSGEALSFGITGGSVDLSTGAAIIEHDGSGVQLFALADDSISATVGNFIIDTSDATVSGNVNGGTDFAVLFDLDFEADGGIGLDISEGLAAALTAVFAAPDLTGAQFGVAVTDPIVAPVPLPASAALLGLGLAGMGVAARRRKAA